MDETSKCFDWRLERGHFRHYLAGRGIDIGCGKDRLWSPTASVRGWDVEDGDAQTLTGVADESYDFVYSSHCLEHMRDIPQALENWRRVIRPGGHLYIVVPDFRIYEKLLWPSIHNADHKHTFSLDISRQQAGRSNHWTPGELFPLVGQVVECGLQDQGFDYGCWQVEQTMGTALSQWYFIAREKA